MANTQSILAVNSLDRVLPHNEDAERAVLGAILLDPQVMHEIFELIDENSFYHTGHGIIYRAIRELYQRNSALDIVTITEELSSQGKLDAIGGAFYLTTLVENIITTANVKDHAQIIRDKALIRRLIHVAGKITDLSFDPLAETNTVIEDAERLIFDIAQRKDQRDIKFFSDLLPDGIARIEESFKNRGIITGLASGFTKLDNLTGGFQKSDLIIIAARPGIGKTSLALNIAAHTAQPTTIRKPTPVLIFSLEMAKEQIVQRMLCTDAGVSSDKIRQGYLSHGNLEDLFKAAQRLHESTIYLDDTPGISVMELRAKALRLKAMVPDLGMIIVDYIQLMTGRARAESRQQEISEISRSLKAIARELKVPVIALSQLNRQVEQRGPAAKPQLSDLRESGALEQDADVIIFIHRPPSKSGQEQIPQKTDNILEIIVAKQRNGPTGLVELAFLQHYTRFAEPFITPPPLGLPEEPGEEESHEA